jgi:hypothetical protein
MTKSDERVAQVRSGGAARGRTLAAFKPAAPTSPAPPGSGPTRIALEIAQPHRDVLAQLILVDARNDPDLRHVQGSLLANVDQLLRELHAENGLHAHRVRRRWRNR